MSGDRSPSEPSILRSVVVHLTLASLTFASLASWSHFGLDPQSIARYVASALPDSLGHSVGLFVAVFAVISPAILGAKLVDNLFGMSQRSSKPP